MAILPDVWIREQAAKGMIEPFVDYQQHQGVISYGVSSYGYDARVADEFKILEEEKNTSLDIQFIKKKSPPVKNNNVVVNVRNQYNELLPFYVIPIGGVPKFNANINVKRTK